jgi:hypothetical protein
MIKVGQLRRWTWKHPPLPDAWEGKTFLIIEERLRWIDSDGVRHSSWTFIIEGLVEPSWRDEDIERMSEVVNVEEHGD